MPETKEIKLKCPTCHTLIIWSEDFPFRPFCCERCQLIDLGEWASENHKITGNSLDINSEEAPDE